MAVKHILLHPLFAIRLVCCVRKQSDSSGPFNSNRQFTLVFSANAGDTARQDFATFGRKTAELCNVFVIDLFSMIDTEAAYFSSRFSRAISSHYISSL